VFQFLCFSAIFLLNTGKGKIDDVGVKAVNDKTLKVELNNPTPYFTQLVFPGRHFERAV
jgi:ABC-type oligopeptide transport system substrate-binding subunit